MISQDDVLRRLMAEEAAAAAETPGAAPAPAPSSLASTHVAGAIAALELIADRNVLEADPAHVIAYAQAEATIAVAISLADLRNLVSRGRP